MREIRCVACENEPISNSGSDIAADMRERVRAMVSEGKSNEEIRAWFSERYGEFVLFRPSADGPGGWLLWGTPFVLLIAGGALVFAIRRRRDRSRETVDKYSYLATLEEIQENDYNLNIRRYADNAPPPEPHDVRAHLFGGIPKAEVESKRPLFDAHGLDPRHLLTDKDDRYLDFADGLAEKADLKKRIVADEGVAATFEETIADLEAQGAEVREVSLDSLAHAVQAYYVIAMSEASSNLARFDGVRSGFSGCWRWRMGRQDAG